MSSKTNEDDDDDAKAAADQQDAEEGLQLLLGGLSSADLSNVQVWDDEDDDADKEKKNKEADCTRIYPLEKPPRQILEKKRSTEESSTASSTSIEQPLLFSTSTATMNSANQQQHAHAFDLAYQCSSYNYCCTTTTATNPQSRIERPPVAIVHLPGRGNGLVATRPVSRGNVIFTERAAVACQIPDNDTSSSRCYSVRACQYCFRSLEPIRSCYAVAAAAASSSSSTLAASSCDNFSRPELPCPELWPVPDFEFDDDECSTNEHQHSETPAGDKKASTDTPHKITSSFPVTTTPHFRIDKYGRLQCRSCQSWFCSAYCQAQFDQQLAGSCCDLTGIIKDLPQLVATKQIMEDGRSNNVAGDDYCSSVDIQASTVLAIRMFATSLQLYRNAPEQFKSSETPLFSGLCGTGTDIQELELGTPVRNGMTGAVVYSLDRVYRRMVQTWHVTTTNEHDDEGVSFSLEYFHQLAAMAARNGFDLRTQSPFQSYYAALVRSTGGRASSQHQAMKARVARALTGTNTGHGGDLERGMDRIVDHRVAPTVVALFSLTARINHSCDPNAQVESQQFVDCHLDLVALRDIRAGDEITISYIGTGPASSGGRQRRQRRQRELQAKYLFECDCRRCKDEQD